jgi:glutamate-1-semialdehyde aminotransferase
MSAGIETLKILSQNDYYEDLEKKADRFYISPSQFEANFLSDKHSEKELKRFTLLVKNFR